MSLTCLSVCYNLCRYYSAWLLIYFVLANADKGGRGRGAYRASKAGLISLTETLAAEVHEAGITVNCICPGGVETEMSSSINLGNMPSGLMRPEEIANVALFLASDESSSVTGTTIDAFGPSNPLYR